MERAAAPGDAPGGGDNSLKIMEVHNEILAHYGTIKKVNRQVEEIVQKARKTKEVVETGCGKKPTPLQNTECSLEHSPDSYIPRRTERVVGQSLVYHHDVETTPRLCSEGQERVYLHNRSQFQVMVVTELYGTIAVGQKAGISVLKSEIGRICTPLRGYPELFSIGYC